MIEKIVKPFINPIKKRVIVPLKRANRWPKLLARWIMKKFRSILGQKEITKASYVPIGNYYVSKRLIVIVILVVLVLYFFVFIKPPKFVNKLLARKPSITAAADGTGAAYTGAARVKNPEGELLYDGELKDGLYQGQGKLYELGGSLVQEGTFENGKLASGSVYDADGLLLYSGQLADGMYAGQGTSYYPDGSVRYQGEFQAGRANGQGRLFREDGTLQYEGGFANEEYSGEGIEYGRDGSIRYQGGFLAGRYNGAGKLLAASGLIEYEGNFNNGQKSGQGILYYPDGSKQYEGMFVNGLFNGTGKLLAANGIVEYEGGFSNGRKSGQGILYYPDGSKQYEGMFVNGQYSGAGQLFAPSGALLYSGAFAAGRYHGSGETYNELGGLAFKGLFVNGELNGPGVWYRTDGSVAFSGIFRDGEPDYFAYLGMSATRVEEVLGMPADSFEVDGMAMTAATAEMAVPDEPEQQDEAAQDDAALAAADGMELADAPITAAADAGALPADADLLMRFNDLRLTFVLSSSADGTTGVREVRIGAGEALEQAYAAYAELAEADPASATFVRTASGRALYRTDEHSFAVVLDDGGSPISATVTRTE